MYWVFPVRFRKEIMFIISKMKKTFKFQIFTWMLMESFEICGKILLAWAERRRLGLSSSMTWPLNWSALSAFHTNRQTGLRGITYLEVKWDHREKRRSQYSTFWHIREKHGFYFLDRLIGPSNEIDKESEFDIFFLFGARKNSLRQINFEFRIFQSFTFLYSKWFFFQFLRFCVWSIKKCIDVFLSRQIQENMVLSVVAYRLGCFWVF